mgnify:CR=1 FL=1
MYILQELPTTAFIQPVPFVPGSRKNVVLVLQKMRARKATYGPETIDDWEEFAQRFPLNDNVEDYITANPEAMHIPFHDILFKGIPYIANKNGGTSTSSRAHCLPEVETTACVRWSMRGFRSENNEGKHAVAPNYVVYQFYLAF